MINEILASREEGQDAPEEATIAIPSCIIEADPNLIVERTSLCTGLNSDEDPNMCEEPEEEEGKMNGISVLLPMRNRTKRWRSFLTWAGVHLRRSLGGFPPCDVVDGNTQARP